VTVFSESTQASPTLVQQLAAMMTGTRAQGVPIEVRSSVRQRILDVLGICAAAASLPTSRAMLRFATTQGGTAQSQAVGTAAALPAPLSALVNGTMAHSLDFDDTHLPSVIHPSATVVPACLAAGELVGAPGPRLLEATAAGLEVCVRLGMAGYDAVRRNSVYFDRGQHATAMCGAIAAAGAVALLLDLDEQGVADAMSVAASMASGLIEANRTGGTVKRVHCGWAAHAAVSAGLLAKLGFTGSPTVLEGRFGFFRAFLDGAYNSTAITDGLGTCWAVPDIHFKPYPANHFTHAGIDAAAALRRRGLRPSEVERIQLGVSGPVLRTIGEPIAAKRCPESGYQAQFSGPYTVVAGLIGGSGLELGLDDFTDELAADPARRALMAKVEVVENPECSEVFPEQFAAVLTAWTTDGRTLVERVMTTRGGPSRPLSDEDLARKFTDNAGRLLDRFESEQVKNAVGELEHGGSAAACLAPLAKELPE
jgi:2-methylcitrate dehydratase PrpD